MRVLLQLAVQSGLSAAETLLEALPRMGRAFFRTETMWANRIQIALIFTLEEFRCGEPDPETLGRLAAGLVGDPPRSMAFKLIAGGILAPASPRPAPFHRARHR